MLKLGTDFKIVWLNPDPVVCPVFGTRPVFDFISKLPKKLKTGLKEMIFYIHIGTDSQRRDILHSNRY